MISSFSWGGFPGAARFEKDKALGLARQVYQRRGMEFGAIDEKILTEVYHLTESTEPQI
jgi:hypothetical protein